MDFNNAGIPDIIQTGDTVFAISVAKGDGIFSGPIYLQNSQAVVGDFNGDTRPDVLVDPSTNTPNHQRSSPRPIPRLEGSGATAAIPYGDDASAFARRSAVPMER